MLILAIITIEQYSVGKAATCTLLGLRRSRARARSRNTAPDQVSADHVGSDEGGAGGGRGRRGTEGRAIGRCRHRRRSPEKQNEEACGAPRKWWPYTCLQLNDSYAVDPLLAPRWTRRRRWTLRPLKRRTYADSHAGGERLHGKTASTRLVLGGARTTHRTAIATPPRSCGRGCSLAPTAPLVRAGFAGGPPPRPCRGDCAQTEPNPSCQLLKVQAPIAVCSGRST